LPVSDSADGQLTNATTWNHKPVDFTVGDLLLSVGRQGANVQEVSLAFELADLTQPSTLSDVRIRFNEQGGVVTSGLTVEISAARELDPLSYSGIARFGLPRTAATVNWSIPAAWDSSGQLIAKWDETPDVSAIVNEVVAMSGWDTSPKTIAFFLELGAATGDNFIQFDDTHPRWPQGGNEGIRPARLIVNQSYYDAFWGKELLCRPGPYSMQMNIIPHKDTKAYVEWGTDGVAFPRVVPSVTIPGGTEYTFFMGEIAGNPGLISNTKYYYRLRYRPVVGSPVFSMGPVRSFVTLPLPGTEGRICATSDAHVTNSSSLGLNEHIDQLATTLLYMPQHVAPERYHVWLDLGDLVVIRAQREVFDLEEAEQRYREAREEYERIAHSLPLVLIRGNHEEVNGWDYDGTSENTAIWSGKALLKYFPPPMPTGWYTGNTEPYPHLGVPGNYFAFNVGDLRIRALDPFLFSLTRPHNGHGEVGGSLNAWDWELGQQQYDWLFNDFFEKQSLFTVTVLHHLTSSYVGSGQYYGRGGIEVAKFSVDGRPSFEWGGEDSTGANVLSQQRSGYSHGAIHDVLDLFRNQLVLKGHDHFYARQTLDDMVYLTMPRPNDTGQQTGNLWGWRFSTWYPVALTFFQENSGFLSIVVDPAGATYEYVQTYPVGGIGQVQDSFTILPPTPTDATLADAPLGITEIRSVVPNPAGIPPRIEYELGAAGPVRVAVYDVSGRLVETLVDETLPAGRHDVIWETRSGGGSRVPSGVYFAKLVTRHGVDAVKMIVLR
jgi:hypothetical protein